MAKYRLMQGTDEVKFNYIPKFNELDNHNLKDIIKFTGVFKTDDELKTYLKNYNLIKSNREFSTQYRFNHKDRKLSYGITFYDDLKFLDVTNIKRFLEQNKNNYELLDKLCSHYKNSYVNGGNIYAIRDYLMKLKRIQAYLDDESEIVQNYKYAINDFVNRECYRIDKKTNKRVFNFKGLRDLGMFLAYQSKKIEGVTTDDMDHTNDLIDYVNSIELEKEKIILVEPVKQKIKKKQIPGQMSFIINDGNVEF